MTKKDLYKEAGVDTHKGDGLVDWLQKNRSSKNQLGKVVSGIGGFAALYQPKFKKLKKPLLIASTDGVGTKLLLGLEHNVLKGLGQDLVAMCVNDLYTVGGMPLFFLDYYATGKLDQKQFQQVLTVINRACKMAEMPLIGGETAELPGLYEKNHFDLAGFVIGVVDETKMLGAHHVKNGDKLFGIASSGFHSNGYSLIRKWLSDHKKIDKQTITKLLEPTLVYSQIPAMVEKLSVKKFHALANITGGGISGNLPRVIPHGFDCHIHRSKLKTPTWMRDFVLSNGATFDDTETVFNHGLGMIAVVDKKTKFDKVAKKFGLTAFEIGSVKKAKHRNEAGVIYHA